MQDDLPDIIKDINSIARIAFKDPVNAMRLLDDDKFHNKDLMWVRACIMYEAARNIAVESHCRPAPEFTEFDVHHAFWKRLHELIPGAKRIKVETDGINIPDGWIDLDGEPIPVEIKRDVFNGKARNQLQRYMTAYSANRGVAVCPKFSCEMDQSIIRVVCRPSI